MRSISIYLQPFGDGERIAFDDQETGAPFQILRYRGQRRRDLQIISPRLEPERDAQAVATAFRLFEVPQPSGTIDQFFGLLEG